jgi:hypothetical protein
MSSLEVVVAEAGLAAVVDSGCLSQDLVDVVVLCLDRDLPEEKLLLLRDYS